MTYTTISETIADYDEFLNMTDAYVEVHGITFEPARILAELDPIAYKCGWLDWCDSEGIDTDDLENDCEF